MTVSGKSIIHCKGKDKGKKYKTYSSHRKALQVHRAIKASQRSA